jgi:NAD(P)-dependent dehydrogenase (short-subunit alcohol dehydrogenase family)
MTDWSVESIPDLTGQVVIVTGATSGIGYEAALVLAGKGAETILAVRDTGRGDACAARIRAAHRDAKLTVSALDLANLASVRDFAERISDTLPRINVLLNNAGLGLQPTRGTTADGFERQFGTNHLGHFALTGRLIPALLRAPLPRVVTIASIAHRRGKIDFDDLQTERPYDGRKAYGESKLANLMFALELDRRARNAGSRLASIAAHPGVASTGFVAATQMGGLKVKIGELAIGLLGQSAARGALPGLYAATMPDVEGGQYWGPDGLMEIRGNPRLATLAPQATDKAVWSRLWSVSEELTGVTFPPLA